VWEHCGLFRRSIPLVSELFPSAFRLLLSVFLQMDRSSLAALVGTSRHSLGPLTDILLQCFLDEQLREREACVVDIDANMKKSAADWLREEPDFDDLQALECHVNWSRTGPVSRVKVLEKPGGRCFERDGRGRCRKMSHRFATFARCPKHHH
jgi:hypothetical protein